MKAVYCPLLRRSDQAQRQDLIGVPAMEVHGLRRVDDGEVRRHGDKAGRVPRVAPLQGLPGGDAGRRAVLQAQDGRVLGGQSRSPTATGRPTSGRSPSSTRARTSSSTGRRAGARPTSPSRSAPPPSGPASP